MKLTADRPPRITAARVGSLRLWLDRSPALVLACCSCRWRRPTRTDRAGWAAAVYHLRVYHDDEPAALRLESIARQQLTRNR